MSSGDNEIELDYYNADPDRKRLADLDTSDDIDATRVKRTAVSTFQPDKPSQSNWNSTSQLFEPWQSHLLASPEIGESELYPTFRPFNDMITYATDGSNSTSMNQHLSPLQQPEEFSYQINMNSTFNNPLPEPAVARLRALITVKEAGIAIGKGGCHVADVRERTNARVQVSEQVPGATDRILSAIGTVDSVIQAFYLMAIRLATNPEGLYDPKTEITFRMLVPHPRMGLLIGRSGSNMRELQEYANVRLFAHGEILPNSIERIFSMTGTADNLLKAFRRVSTISGEVNKDPQIERGLYVPFPPYPPVSMYPRPPYHIAPAAVGPAGPYMMYPTNPMANPIGYYAPSIGVYSTAPIPYGTIPATSNPEEIAPSSLPPVNMSSYAQGPMTPMTPMYPVNPMEMNPGINSFAIGQVTQTLSVPGDVVGGLIGKGGVKINQIRRMSGSQIKIMDPIPGSSERLICLTGTPDCNQRAMNLIHRRLKNATENLIQ